MTNRPVIAFVHGDFGNGPSSFGKLAAEIGDEYRAILLDRPGFATDPEHPERYTFAGDAAELLLELRDAGVDAFHLVGHSYGALVAIVMAVQAPARIKSLHLIEPPLLNLIDLDDAARMAERVRALQAAHRDEDLDATTGAFFEMIGAGHVPERLRGSEEWEQLVRYAARFARNEPPGEFPVDHWHALAPDFPILLYSGGRSHQVLQAVTAALARTGRARRHTHVPDAGHAVQMAGDAFLQSFLPEVVAAETDWAQRRPGAAEPAN